MAVAPAVIDRISSLLRACLEAVLDNCGGLLSFTISITAFWVVLCLIGCMVYGWSAVVYLSRYRSVTLNVTGVQSSLLGALKPDDIVILLELAAISSLPGFYRIKVFSCLLGDCK